MAILPCLITAQSIKKTEKLLNRYEYERAKTRLKRNIVKGRDKAQAIPLLAECYRHQRDVFNMKAWYSQAITLPGASPKNWLYYGMALQSTGDYTAAREAFETFSQKDLTPELGQLMMAHCDSVLGPWSGKPPKYDVHIVNKINTTQTEFGPALSDGDLYYTTDFVGGNRTRHYGWTGRGYFDVMKSSPATAGDFWGDMKDGKRVLRFNTVFNDGPVSFSRDGNQVFLTRSFYGKSKKEDNVRTNQLKIYSANKTLGVWGKLKPFNHNSLDYSVGHPALSNDGNTLYFTSDMPGGSGGFDLWMCTKQGDSWGEPRNLGPIVNTAGNEVFPSVAEDGTLYFSSDGQPGYGGLDIFKTQYYDGDWTTPINVQMALNSPYDDFAIVFAPGMKNGFFSSNRPGGMGNDDIYAFRDSELAKNFVAKKVKGRQVPVSAPAPVCLSGVVKDKITGKPIENATLFIHNPNTNKVSVIKTAPDGSYCFPIDRGGDYTVKAMKPTYIADCGHVQVPQPITREGVNPKELLLDKLDLGKVFKIQGPGAENIYYDFDKSDIRPDAARELNKLVMIMKENPVNVELGSHTDCRGTNNYNEKLSQRRAESAVNYIISQGISADRIIAKGYGEQKPVNRCIDGVDCSEAEHQLNRRTEFIVIEFSTPKQQIGQFNPDIYLDGEDVDPNKLPKDFFDMCK